MTLYKITDENGPYKAELEGDQIAEGLRPWFPEAPDEVLDALTDLQRLAMRGEYLGGVAEYLGVRVEVA